MTVYGEYGGGGGMSKSKCNGGGGPMLPSCGYWPKFENRGFATAAAINISRLDKLSRLELLSIKAC